MTQIMKIKHQFTSLFNSKLSSISELNLGNYYGVLSGIMLVMLFGIVDNAKLYSQEKNDPMYAYQIDQDWIFNDVDGKEIFRRNDIIEVFGFREGIITAKIQITNKENKIEEKWSGLSSDGKTLFDVDYDEMGTFNSGYAIVANYTNKQTKDKVFGYVDKKGKLIVPMEYVDALPFSENLAYVMKEGKRGYLSNKLDNTGTLEMAITLMGDKVGYNFSEGYAAVSNNEYAVGYIDTTGKVVIDYRFDEPAEFSEQKAKVTLIGKFGFIDKWGQIIINLAYDDVKPFKNRRSFFAQNDENGKPKWALVDELGNRLTEFIFQNCEPFSNNFGMIKFDGSYGFINKNGEFAFSGFYNFALPFNSSGMAFVSNLEYETLGYINSEGEIKLKLPKFENGMDLILNRKIEAK